jgi:quinone-modifying oxidoreductase, subunit QmoC
VEALAQVATAPKAPTKEATTVKRKKRRPVKDRSRFEAQLDPRFAHEIAAEVPDGERLLGCLQCGTCSGVCPLSTFMDLTPRKAIELTRAGARDEVLSSYTIWVCASCYACTVQCPKEIPITQIMHALRRRALEANTYPRRFTNPVMARELVAMAEDRGRSTESWIAMKAYLRTDPSQILKHALVGMRLMLRGRMSLKRESIHNRRQLAELLRAVEAAPATPGPSQPQPAAPVPEAASTTEGRR